LDRASEAAERLIADTAARVTRSAEGSAGSSAGASAGAKPPPSGWQAPGAGAERSPNRELDALLSVVQSLRELVPPELVQRLAEALRELLLALQAVVDWYLERSQQRDAGPAEVRDIPIQ
jgi:hypothetical protein